jgi:restriction system protein
MQGRKLAAEIARGAIAVMSLPFTLFRRSARAVGERSQSARRAKFDISKWNLYLLRHLEWRRFEELGIAYFEALGMVTSITKSRADGGADIIMRVEANAAPHVLAWCKAWSPYPIGIKPLQELHDAMAPAGVREGAFVTSGRFTPEAAKFAAKHSILLLDGAQLLEQFAALAPEKALALLQLATKGDFLTPTCPCCSIKMTSRKSTGEGRAFWGCVNYPRCKQTFSTATLAP